MSTIQESRSFGTPINMLMTNSIDCGSPENMALEIAKSASPDSTGKEILQRFREAVTKSANRHQKHAVSSDTKEKSDSLFIFKDEPSDMDRNNMPKDNLSVKERVQQSIAQRRAVLKEKSMNVLPSSKLTHKIDGVTKKVSAIRQPKMTENMKSLNEVTSEDNQNSAQPSASDDVVSIGSVSLELNTLDSDSMEQHDLEEQHMTNMTSDPVREDVEVEEVSNQSQSDSMDIGVPEGAGCSTPVEEVSSVSHKPKGIRLDEDELLSVSGQSESISSESSSVQDSEILEPLSPPTDSHFNSNSKISSCRDPLTPSESSVKTFAIEEQFSVDMSTEQFKYIFSPSVSRELKSFIHNSSPGTYSHISEGGTVIPDVSISGSTNELGPSYHQKRTSSESVDYQQSLSSDEATEQTKSSFHYLDDVVSPVSKLLVTGIPPSNGEESYGMSRSTASSLIERNKTLMKEVRFADQTCVELSEKNSSMVRDLQRVKGELQSLSAANKDLHESVVRSSKVSAKLEEERDSIKIRMEEERSRFEMQIELLKQNLEDEKKRNTVLTEKLEEKTSYLSSVEKKLVSMSSAYKIVHEERNDAKKAAANLTDKLIAMKSTNYSNSDAEPDVSSTHLYRLQNKIDQLEKIAEDRLFALDREREMNEMLEEQVVLMKQKCADIEDKLEQNLNASFSSSFGSPSGSSTFSLDDSNEVSSTLKLREKLSSAKVECEEYKRELDSIILQIKSMQRLPLTPPPEKMLRSDSPASKKLLSIAQELARTCEIVNTAAKSRVGLLEERNNFLTQSISHLQEICLEDSSSYSGDSSLEIVDIRSLNHTPPKNIMLPSTDCGVQSTVSSVSRSRDAEMKRKNEEIDRLKNEIHELQKRYTEVIDELNEVHEIANWTENNLSKEQEKSRRYEESIDDYRFKLQETSKKVQDSLSALQSKESQVEALNDQVSRLEQQINVVRVEWHRYNEEYDAHLSAKNEDIRLLSLELDDMKEKYKSAKHEMSENQSLLAMEQKYRENAEGALREQKSLVHNLTQQLHEATIAVKTSEKELEDLNIELHEAYESIRVAERRCTENIEENATQKQKNEEAITKLESCLQEREDQIDSAKNQLLQAKSDLESLKIQNEKLYSDLHTAHETISELRVECDQYANKYQQLLGDLRDVKSIDESQVSEKDALISKLQRKNESLDRKRSRLRDYVNSLNAKCSAWEESMHEQQTETSTFRTKYMQAKSQIEQLVKHIDELKKSEPNLSCKDCKYLRRALVMEIANHSQKANDSVVNSATKSCV